VRQYRIATAPRTRLACVKHAASVRSEPGSNSRLKPVAWDKKSPPKTSGEPADPSKFLSLDLLKPFALEKGKWYERILAHRIDCQRAKAPLSSRKAYYATERVYEELSSVSTADSRFPQESSRHVHQLSKGLDEPPASAIQLFPARPAFRARARFSGPLFCSPSRSFCVRP
jgi:hypothetical protein